MKKLTDIIPDKSHTFSKAHHQYPTGISPAFATKAKGCKLYTDIGEYTDWSMGLGPVIKGYGFEPLNQHLNSILSKGIAFSLPSLYEFEVARKLIDSIQFGEQVRFARNGSDVTSAAVRVSRHFTQKNKIICNGYHGWQDWYIGSTSRNSGVPEEVSSQTIKINGFSKEELGQAFNKNSDEIACLIIEPMIGDEPDIEFLEYARQLCNEYNAILIFDECWTGFRCLKTGAIGYTGVEPDLVCYAKALGNGVPVAAIVGNKNIMRGFEDVFFSFTHASDPIGIGAADFMLDYLDENFFKELSSKTRLLKTGIDHALAKITNPEFQINCTSYPGKIVMSPVEQEYNLYLKTFIQKEFLSHNILFNMFFAVAEDHGENEIKECSDALHGAVDKLNDPAFNLVEDTKQQLVKAVFRAQK